MEKSAARKQIGYQVAGFERICGVTDTGPWLLVGIQCAWKVSVMSSSFSTNCFFGSGGHQTCRVERSPRRSSGEIRP